MDVLEFLVRSQKVELLMLVSALGAVYVALTRGEWLFTLTAAVLVVVTIRTIQLEWIRTQS